MLVTDSGEVVIIRPKKGWKLDPGEGMEAGFWRRYAKKNPGSEKERKPESFKNVFNIFQLNYY